MIEAQTQIEHISGIQVAPLYTDLKVSAISVHIRINDRSYNLQIAAFDTKKKGEIRKLKQRCADPC